MSESGESTGAAPRLRLAWGGATHPGRVRTVNQDALFADHGLFVVADGMGGHRGGEVASRIAVRAISSSEHSALSQLIGGVESANAAVWEYAEKNPELKGMGTTLTAIAVLGSGSAPMLGLANVGDSRAYRWRDGELTQLTDDHSYVAELVRRGQLDADEAETHPYRNMVTRAIGVAEGVDVDSWELPPVAGDRYILCSDGLVNEVTDSVIATLCGRQDDPSETARLLIDQANTGGGRDNITVVVVHIDIEDADTAALGEHVDGPAVIVEDRVPPVSLDTGMFAPVSPDEPTALLEAAVGMSTEPIPILAGPPAPTESPEPPVEPSDGAPSAHAIFSEPVAEHDLPIVMERIDPLAEFELPAISNEAGLPWLSELEPAVAPVFDDDATTSVIVPPTQTPAPPLTTVSPTTADPVASSTVGPSPTGWSAPVHITFRTVLAVFLVIGAAIGAIALAGSYARGTYHVGFAGDEVVIYQGRPGGLLWFDPTLEEGSGVYRSELAAATSREIESLVEVSSLEAARAFVNEIRSTVVALPPPGTTEPPADDSAGSAELNESALANS